MGRENVEDIYPLSPAQQGMLFHTLEAPETGVYVDQLACDLEAPEGLDGESLREACRKVMERHPVLRTGFLWKGREQPLQVVYREVEPVFDEEDWSGLSSGETESRLRQLMAADRLEPFELARAPLLRVKLLRREPHRALALFTYHHILMDAWSLGLVFADLLACYRAARGLAIDLPPVRRFRDYIGWLARQDLAAAEGFWRGELAGFDHPTPLPLASGEVGSSAAGAPQHDFEKRYPRSLGARLRGFARRHNLTLGNLVQGAWGLLLGRHAGIGDVVFGLTVSGRPRELDGVESMVGLFINTLPQRVRLDDRRELVGWLRELQERQLHMAQYEYSPLVDVRSWSEVRADQPLFESILVIENVPLAEAAEASSPTGTGAGTGVLSARLRHYEPKTNFPLTLLIEPEEEIGVRLLFDADRFERTAVGRLAEHFGTLLEAIAASAPEKPLGALSLLAPAQRQQVVAEWNDTRERGPWPGAVAWHELFDAQVRDRPGAVAVVEGERRWSYAELDRASRRLEARLRHLGLGFEDRIGLCAERSGETLAALLAVSRLGAAYVPLDPAYPRERLRLMLGDARLRAIVGEPGARELLGAEELSWVALGEDGAAADPPGGAASFSLEKSGPEKTGPDSLAYVIYTSGSTGRPKGVQVSHRGLVNFLGSMARRPGLGAGDVWAAVTSLSFDISALELYLPLAVGARVVLVGRDEASDGEALAARLEASGASVMQATPATWLLLLEAGWRPGPGLRMLCGGEALGRDLTARLLAGGGELWNLYGPTETTIWSAVARCSPGEGPVAIGRPIANTEIYLVDGRLRPVPMGAAGELVIGGDGLARGYFGRAAQTAERFVPDPLAVRPGSRLYRTGDLARGRSDGEIEFLGRLDHQVKLRGHRIEPGEIEAVLEHHPGVRRAAVRLLGESAEDQRLVAWVAQDPHYTGGLEAPGLQLDEWRRVWGETYAGSTGEGDPNLNLAGWVSRATGRPIPAEEMREWVEVTVERILATKPRRVLEIGCGSGMLLVRIAPHCERYWATDLTAEALDHVRGQVPALPDPAKVKLIERPAEDFTGFEPGSFDLVVLNSVVQYFPSVEYLVRVLEGAVGLLAPGGRIFIGDVRSLLLLEAQNLEALLASARNDLSVAEVRAELERQRLAERELLLAPEFFRALAGEVPEIDYARIEVKRGRTVNELTRYRYDVVLEVGEGTVPAPPRRWLDLAGESFDLDSLGDLLASVEVPALGLRGLHDARLAEPLGWLAALEASAPGDDVETLRRRVSAGALPPAAAIDPEQLGAALDDSPWRAELGIAGEGADGRLEVILRRRDTPREERREGPGTGARARSRAWANNPVHHRLRGALVEELRQLASQRLPAYMVPAAFVVLDAMPLTPNGKLDRKALPSPGASVADLADAPPRGQLEQFLAAIWQEILGVRRIDRDAHFFALGGHSLSAGRLISRLRKDLQVDLPIRAVFDAPTLSELAARLEAELRRGIEPPPPIEKLPRGAPMPLSFSQHRLWLVHRLEPESGAYNLPLALRLRGRVDPNLLGRTLGEVVRRHEVLRSRFVEAEGEPRVEIDPPAPIHLPLIGLSALPVEEREALARRIVQAEAWRPFDLARQTPLRAALLELEEGDRVLLLVIHHIAVDGASFDVLVREARALYEAFRDGRESPLGELAVQYADFAAWQRDWLAGEELERQLGYWRERLGEGIPALQLPFAGPRPPRPSGRGGRLRFELGGELSPALRELAQRHDSTPFIVLLAGLQTLFHRLTGQEDVVIGSEVAGRTRVETEPLIGFFVNIVMLRGDLSGDPPFTALLKDVRTTVLEALAHQDLPFDRLVQELDPERIGGRTTPLEMVFVMDEAPDSVDDWPGSVGIEGFPLDDDTAKFDLLLMMNESPRGFDGTWTYNRDLFDRAAAERIDAAFRALLESAVRDPEARLSQLDLKTESQRRRDEEERREKKRSRRKKMLGFEAPTAKVSPEEAVRGEALEGAVSAGEGDHETR